MSRWERQDGEWVPAEDDGLIGAPGASQRAGRPPEPDSISSWPTEVMQHGFPQPVRVDASPRDALLADVLRALLRQTKGRRAGVGLSRYKPSPEATEVFTLSIAETHGDLLMQVTPEQYAAVHDELSKL